MKRAELERRTPLRSSSDKVAEFVQRGRRNSTSTRKRRSISPATPQQRARVKDRDCIVCGGTPVDPAHLLSRSVCPDGADDPRAVIALCRRHHREFDEGGLSVLEHLEPSQREELAFAVQRFGLISTLEFVTNQKWRPTTREEGN